MVERNAGLPPERRIEFYFALGIAAIQEGRYDEAASHFAKTARAVPGMGYHFFHISALGLAGRAEEARPIVRLAMELYPRVRIGAIFKWGLVREIAEKLAEGARLSGVPE